MNTINLDKSTLTIIGLLLGFFGQLSLVTAQDNNSSSAVSQLSTLLSKTTSIQADVEQLILDQDGREIQQSTARLLVQKPDHFYWEIVEPYQQLMTSNGETIWIFEPDLEQVTIQNFDADLSRTPLLLLNAGAGILAETFDITVTNLPLNNRTRFVLLPIIAGNFERLSLTFFNESLEEMQIEDSLGQKTSLTFTNLENNILLEESQFVFEIPDNIEVIDGT